MHRRLEVSCDGIRLYVTDEDNMTAGLWINQEDMLDPEKLKALFELAGVELDEIERVY